MPGGVARARPRAGAPRGRARPRRRTRRRTSRPRGRVGPPRRAGRPRRRSGRDEEPGRRDQHVAARDRADLERARRARHLGSGRRTVTVPTLARRASRAGSASATRPCAGGQPGPRLGCVHAASPVGARLRRRRRREVRGVLSPSRAGDFMSCPLLFRYRTIDRLPEGSSPDAVRGTLVHQVLEEIFDLPADRAHARPRHTACSSRPGGSCSRCPDRPARSRPTLDEPAWLDSAHTVLDRWFILEDPTRLEPADREVFVEATLDSGLSLRGIVDRLDERPTVPCGWWTTRPAVRGVRGVRVQGAVPAAHLRADPVAQPRGGAADAAAGLPRHHERDRPLRARRGRPARHRAQGRRALGGHRAGQGDRRVPAQPGKQCDWCAFKAHCPAWGGELLPMPAPPSRWARLKRATRRRWRRVRRRLDGRQ